MKNNVLAKDLPFYDRAIERYPHLRNTKPAKAFCFALGRLSAVPAISPLEYLHIARIAIGRNNTEQA